MATNNIDMFVDETYLLALLNDEPIPIDDEKFAEELHFQEALYSSSSKNSPVIPKYEEHYFRTSNKQEGKQANVGKATLGESSKSKQIIFCGICMEHEEAPETFKGLNKCNHTYCTNCIVEYIGSKIKENIALVECPDPNCKRVIEPEDCSSILPKEVFSRWENALCENLILGSQRFYCPYKDCSVLMVDDGLAEVRQSECPSCRRLFCARCHVVWHVGFSCEEYESLDRSERGIEDIMVMNLAKDKQWKRCSNCRFIVEKQDGCVHITCRCKYEFCYNCEAKWSTSHSC